MKSSTARTRDLPQIRRAEQPTVGIEQRLRLGQADESGFALGQETEQVREAVTGFDRFDLVWQAVDSQGDSLGGKLSSSQPMLARQERPNVGSA